MAVAGITQLSSFKTHVTGSHLWSVVESERYISQSGNRSDGHSLQVSTYVTSQLSCVAPYFAILINESNMHLVINRNVDQYKFFTW